MNKIRLNESQLNRLIQESIYQVLNEEVDEDVFGGLSGMWQNRKNIGKAFKNDGLKGGWNQMKQNYQQGNNVWNTLDTTQNNLNTANGTIAHQNRQMQGYRGKIAQMKGNSSNMRNQNAMLSQQNASLQQQAQQAAKLASYASNNIGILKNCLAKFQQNPDKMVATAKGKSTEALRYIAQGMQMLGLNNQPTAPSQEQEQPMTQTGS